MASNNMFCLRLVANDDIYVVTEAEEDTTIRRKFHRDIDAGLVEDCSWIPTSARREGTIFLLGRDDSHLGTPDEYVGWR